MARHWGNIVVVLVLGALVLLNLTAGPTAAFLWTYRATGSQTLAGMANGFLRATAWPLTAAGYHPDNRDDTAFRDCIRAAGYEPPDVAAQPQMYQADLDKCAAPYANSRIDLSNETQAKFPFRLIQSPFHPANVLVLAENGSTDDIVMGADIVFQAGGSSEFQHVTFVAFPGQHARIEIPVAILKDDSAWKTFAFYAVPSIARVTKPDDYALPAAPAH